jgi:hypothetical protein
METIIEKIRNLINDNLKHNKLGDLWQYQGLSKVFTLENANVDKTSLIVYKDGTVWGEEGENYSYNLNTEEITVHEETGEEFNPGDNLRATYDYYEKYSENEIKGHIKAALSYLSVEKYETYTIETDEELDPEPTEQEENLIALIASILIKGNIRSYRTSEVTVVFNENLSKEEKISRIINNFDKASGIVLEYVDLAKEYDTEED